MCYPDSSRPPDHGRGGEVASFGDLVLTSEDGNRFDAYESHPAAPAGAGMVVLPDVRGLHNFYRGLCCRFAEAGIDAVAIDYFGRTAGRGARGDDFDYRPHREQTTPEGIAMDVAAAVGHLRSEEGGAVDRIFTIGFCFGGGNSWRQAAQQPGLRGAIGLYGRPEAVRDWIPQMKSPIMILAAGADVATPVEENERFDRELSQTGVPHKYVLYPRAPHSYFDRTYDEFADECRGSWDEILAFVERPPG